MITLTMNDEKRLEVIQRVFRGELTVVEAALVSERQCYRVKARVTKVGAKGVVHANRGRPCKHKDQGENGQGGGPGGVRSCFLLFPDKLLPRGSILNVAVYNLLELWSDQNGPMKS